MFRLVLGLALHSVRRPCNKPRMHRVAALARAVLHPQKQSDVFAVIEQDFRAWPWLCDALGHVNNARYLDLMGSGRFEWLARLGLLRHMIFNGYSFIVGGVQGLYRRPIPRLAPFSLETRAVFFDDKWACFEQTFFLDHDRQGKIAARMLTRGRIHQRGRPVHPLKPLHEVGMETPARPALTPEFEQWLTAQQAALDSIRDRDAPLRPPELR